MSKTVVHMIGQAHLDPVWLWRWTEGRAEALATSRSAADRLSEYPDFHFVRGEAQVYEWIEQEDPRLFAQILTLIEQGRWHVVNGMIIQPDMNLPQGESIVRQILLGKAYMRERLGVEPTVAYCVDSFGHAGTLPQVFKKCGFEAYVFMRPGPHEKTLPEQLFWWQGPDGSRILAFRITDAYQTRGTDLWNHIERAVQEKPERLRDTMCFFGVGNHGGGPTREQIDVIHSLMQSSADLDIRFSSPEAYLAAIRPDAGAAPTVADELQMHAVGCYSANSTLKRGYRRAECQLLIAERMAVLAAAWADRPAPAARLRTLWHELCLNQFHDTLSGSTTKEGADDAIMALGGIMSAAQEIANDAGRAIAAQVDTHGPGGAVLLFNPHAEDLVQYVEYEPWTEWESWESGQWGLTDEQGRAVPHQRIDAQSAMGWPDAAVNRLVFCAEVPALGYRLYRFARGGSRTEAAGSARIDDNGLSNDRLAIRLDPRSGVIVSCVDKGTGTELVGPEGWNVPLVLEDRSDTWSHGVQGYTQVIGRFGAAQISAYERGPLQASLLVERSFEGSTWLQQIILRHGEAELEIRNWLQWQGRWRLLKLAFAVPVHGPRSVHDAPFGWCERPCDGREVPVQMWSDVFGSALAGDGRVIGLAVLNDGKYGCDVSDSTLRVTVLRSPPYAYHEPHAFGSKGRYDWIDQGGQEFTLVLRPHVGDWRDAGIVGRARTLNLPAVPITMHGHSGSRPPVDSLLELTCNEMELTALKPAEDGDGYIVRLADRHGRGGQGELCWCGERFPVRLAPFEVATWRLVERAGRWQAFECDMLERLP